MMEIIRVEIDNHQQIISNQHLHSHVEFLANELWQPPYSFNHIRVYHHYDMSRNLSIIIAKGDPLDGQSIIYDSFTIDNGMAGKVSNIKISITYKSLEKQSFMDQFCKILMGMVK